MKIARLAWLFGVAVPLLFACGDDGAAPGGGDTGAGSQGGNADTGGGGEGGSAVESCTSPAPVPCEADITNGMIVNTPEGAGFHSTIDATAGGAFAADPESYTYGRFTDAGLEKVDIADQDALGSMDWDIAFRRYVVRINSGHSGPSCVSAARVPGAATYDEVTSVPAELTYRTDRYFTDTCELIPDGTGLDDSPATALSSYWTYPGCVQMTGNVYVVRLASGRQLKFTVSHYYNEAAQAECQSAGTVPMGNNGSATFQVRWSFL
jgi:hypothetical protein